MKTKKLSLLSLFAAISLTLFLVEAQIPLPIAVPGVKLGLANLVTLFLLVKFSPGEAACVLFVRIFLGNLLTGQYMSLCFSLAGGALSFLAMWGLVRLLHGKYLWFVSIMGGIFHNAGQTAVAFFWLGGSSLLYYLPFLLLSGIAMGFLTGAATQAFLKAWHYSQS